MMAVFLSALIVRPHHCWTVLHVSILAVLFLTLNADSEDSNCVVEILVRRNTAYKASPGEHLRINCTVQFCNISPPEVYWYKLEKTAVLINVSSRLKTEWKMSSPAEGVLFLSFENILMSDSGEYQCRGGLSVGHTINVSVYGDDELTNVTPADINGTNSDSQHTEDVLMYVYTALGIAAFVIIVITISVASLHGCKGKSKKETQTDNQYVAIPMAEQPARTSPRGSPSAPPSRRSTQRKTSPTPPNELPLPRDNEHLYGKMKDRERHAVEEETSSIVYAALNHQPVAGAAARPRRPMEEISEYAAIRVKDR